MRDKRILFHDPDPHVLRVAERALNATGSQVELIGDKDALSRALSCASDQAGSCDLIMLNPDTLVEDSADWFGRLEELNDKAPQTHLVLHTTAPTEEYLPLMAERRFLRNMIAKRDNPIESDELIITAQKLLRGDLFGLQKYLLWGIEPYRVRICESAHKPEYIGAVARYASLLGCNARTVEMIETIVDELVTNAIYNAPRTADGEAKYARLSRRESVVLDEHEIGELQFACDGSYIAIAQIDPFGALTQDTVISYLNRCLVKGPNQFSEASGGAGIGLYRVFQSLSKFVVNIDPGRRTEVLCLIDLRLSMRRFHQMPKSFHIFVSNSAANSVGDSVGDSNLR